MATNSPPPIIGSLLSAFSKVFEKAIYSRIVHFWMHTLYFLSIATLATQRSTELSIYNTLSYLHNRLDSGKNAVGLYFDLSKAFDTISHDILLNKLRSYGIRGQSASLIGSYLTNRKQNVCVRYEGRYYYSTTVTTNQGVLQGSILGPLLFILYVNDLNVALERGKICQYADDTSVIVCRPSINQLSTDFCRIVREMLEWCDKNSLHLNLDKTRLLHFGKSIDKMASIYIHINHKSLPCTDSVKFLALYHQIDRLCAKLSSLCALLRRIRNIISTQSITLFYFGCVQSVLMYRSDLLGFIVKCTENFCGTKNNNQMYTQIIFTNIM